MRKEPLQQSKKELSWGERIEARLKDPKLGEDIFREYKKAEGWTDEEIDDLLAQSK